MLSLIWAICLEMCSGVVPQAHGERLAVEIFPLMLSFHSPNQYSARSAACSLRRPRCVACVAVPVVNRRRERRHATPAMAKGKSARHAVHFLVLCKPCAPAPRAAARVKRPHQKALDTAGTTLCKTH